MLKTTITLNPQEEWRDGMTSEELVEELDKAIQFPGLTNAWAMPIKTRIDMLATGIKTTVGHKLLGGDQAVLLEIIDKFACASQAGIMMISESMNNCEGQVTTECLPLPMKIKKILSL